MFYTRISVHPSIFLGLSSHGCVVATVMDSIGLGIQMNRFIVIDKYLLGTHFVPDAMLGLQWGVNPHGTTLMEL